MRACLQVDAAKRATVEQLLAHPFLTQQIVVPTQSSKRFSTSAAAAATAGFKRGVSIDLDTHRWDAAWMSCSSSTASSTSSYSRSEAHSKAHTVAGHPQRHSSSQEGADSSESAEHSVDLAHSIAGTDTTVQTAPAASTPRTNIHIGVY